MSMFGDRSEIVSKGVDKTPSKNLQEMELEEFRETMQRLATGDAEKMAVLREAVGVTESLSEPRLSPRPQLRPEGLGQAPKPTSELAPETSPRPQLRPEGLAPEDRVLSLNLPTDVEEDTDFLSSVDTVSKNLGMDKNDLLRAMAFETGGTFSTSIKNPTGSATGLIQFIESTAESLGTSTEALAKMTRTEQMKFVEKYLLPFKGRLKDFGDVYMAIHLPVAVGKSDDYVIYDNSSLRTQAYKQNKGLDTNKDGKVTKGEAVARAASDTE